MLCALTVRKLKPGTFEQFREAFMAGEADAPMPAGSQFFMVRNTGNPDEVICFGLFRRHSRGASQLRPLLGLRRAAREDHTVRRRRRHRRHVRGGRAQHRLTPLLLMRHHAQ
jgi:hypothetical protein